MDALTARIYATVRAARDSAAQSEASLSVFLRSFNAELLAAASSICPHAQKMPAAADVDRLLCAFMWTTGCCRETVHISDTYNSTHLCGIVLCKHLCIDTRTHAPALLSEIFTGAGAGRMHIDPRPMHTMPYDTLVQVLAALQHEWPRLTTTEPRAAVVAVLACMARFGAFLLFQQSAQTLDDIQKREPVAENAPLFRPTKRCTRAVVTTCLCLLRNAAMLACVRHTHVRHVDAPHTRTLVYAALFQAEHGAHAKLAPTVRACAARVRSIRASLLGSMDHADIDDPNVLWAFLIKHLGSHRIGVLPRRRDDALVAFLQTAVLFVVQQARPVSDVVICSATMRVIETALRYFYVVPSADRFRHLDLLETISSGHRLCYAMEYAQFDTVNITYRSAHIQHFHALFFHALYFHALRFPCSVISMLCDFHALRFHALRFHSL